MRTQSAAQRFNALRTLPELSACSDQDVWSLVAYADEARVCAGERVAQEGRHATQFLVVIEGILREGYSLIGPGAGVGWDAMWDRAINATTVVAETDARVLVMSHGQFRAVKALVSRESRSAHVADEAPVQIVA